MQNVAKEQTLEERIELLEQRIVVLERIHPKMQEEIALALEERIRVGDLGASIRRLIRSSIKR